VPAVVAIAAIGGIGAFVLNKSHAMVPPPDPYASLSCSSTWSAKQVSKTASSTVYSVTIKTTLKSTGTKTYNFSSNAHVNQFAKNTGGTLNGKSYAITMSSATAYYGTSLAPGVSKTNTYTEKYTVDQGAKSVTAFTMFDATGEGWSNTPTGIKCSGTKVLYK
jgi:hypothetical protein